MKILGLGVPELLIILAVFLVIFGPKYLPKLGSAFGKTAKSMREGMGEVQKKVDESFADDEDEEDEVPVRALKEANPEEAADEEAIVGGTAEDASEGEAE